MRVRGLGFRPGLCEESGSLLRVWVFGVEFRVFRVSLLGCRLNGVCFRAQVVVVGYFKIRVQLSGSLVSMRLSRCPKP